VYEWNAVFGPAGTPSDVVDRLGAAIRTSMQHAEVAQRVAALGGETVAGTPQEAAQFVQQQTSFWGDVIRRGNIKPD